MTLLLTKSVTISIEQFVLRNHLFQQIQKETRFRERVRYQCRRHDHLNRVARGSTHVSLGVIDRDLTQDDGRRPLPIRIFVILGLELSDQY